ncbi:hypothetical protein GOV13_00380 [Candidatus Pacearchaeota archaeon]|nr:hypothetical protein [Candidatus Pacearchaeota archaeon]
MINKKGMSGIITAVIIIGIALAAVGIVWYVINTVTQEQAANVENGSANVYKSCNETGSFKMNTTDTCNQTIKYTGGEKCCTGPVTS